MISGRSAGKRDPLEEKIEQAFSPGIFISYRQAISFVENLESLSSQISKLIKLDPDRTARLYETFIDGCFEKMEEISDSDGYFEPFVEALFIQWIKARQAAHHDPAATVSRLLAWMDNDPYGLCSDIEKEVAKAFDRDGLDAFEKQIRMRFEGRAKSQPVVEGESHNYPEADRRHWGEVLRTLYFVRKNIAAYVALAEETGLTAQDCLAIAQLAVGRHKPAEALAWVERGIMIDKKNSYNSSAEYNLVQLKRELLTKLGRGNEALAAAWDDYRKHPGIYTYEELMKFVPKIERAQWHAKAMEAVGGAELQSLVELLCAVGEIKRLTELVRRIPDAELEGLSHYITEPAAKKLEKAHPDIAARLWRAQGMRILNEKKSKYYSAALSNFEQAKHCFERAGLAAEWNKTLNQVRAGHQRKSAFMPGFERLVAGSGPGAEPSFLERAKARWGGKH